MEHELPPEPEGAELALSSLMHRGQEDQSTSILESLRKQHKELETATDVFLPLPGYDKEPPILLAKYRLLEGKEINEIARKVSREVKDEWRRQVLSAVDTFIAACEGMFIDLKDGEEPQPMTIDGNPVLGYNADLARALESESGTARQVVFSVFAGNEVAIMQHNIRLSLWMGDPTRKMDEGILGEL